MKDFQDLLALALVGTSRGALPQHSGTPLADTLNTVQGDPESVLLSRAALSGLVRFAGQTATATPLTLAAPLTLNLPALAPAESLPEAPAAFARHLPALLGGPLLPEWLHLCAEAGWRVPHKHLPALLDLARSDTDLRESLRPVVGERGGWLAQFHPDWRFSAVFSEDAWAEATEAQKENLFRELWRQDTARAREFLTRHFAGEKAGVRGRLLDVIAATPNAADTELEPLLETALTDRSSEVQASARELLRRQPGSAFNQRMAARLKAALQPEKVGLVGKLLQQDKKYTLHLPPADPDLKRDGFDAKPSAQAYLSHIFNSAHPETLLAALEIGPVKLVVVAKTFDVLDELQRAVLGHRHVELAKALLNLQRNNPQLRRIVARENVIQAAQDAIRQDDLELLSLLVNDLPTPWPADLSGDLLQMLGRSLQGVAAPYSWNPRWRNNISHKVLLCAHPDARRPAPPPEDASEFVRQTMNELNATLDLRLQMWRDFRKAQG